MSDFISGTDLLLKASGIEKTYHQGGKALHVLQGLDLKLEVGEIVALVGPSGCGKSTLLHILGLLDQPTKGTIHFGQYEAHKLGEQRRTALRRNHIGFVYQFHHLLAEFSALENAAMPLIIKGIDKSRAHKRAQDVLESLGLGHRIYHRPAELSGGEQQRVAVARALVHKPDLLLGDEPTGNLDPDTSAEVLEILLEQARERGVAALIATHNMELAAQMDRVVELKAGKILPY